MSFLAPAWLALGALAAVPLLLHVLRQRAGTVIDFPAVRWLVQAEQESSRKLRLRQLLVLLLRMLAILAISLAAARPRLDSLAGTPRALAIVLDDSPSTGALVNGAPVLPALVREARALAAASRDAERLWLVTADGRVHTGAAAVDSVLAAARPSPAGADLSLAVRKAVSLVRGAGGTVAVVTDAQASAWRGAADAAGVRTIVHAAAGTPAPNAAVATLVAVPPRWNPRGALEASLRLAGDSLPWVARVGTAEVARGTAVRAGGDSLVTLRIPAVAPDTGWQVATLAVTGADALAADDTARAAVHVAPPTTVRADAGPYVAAAVAALEASGRVRRGDGARAVAIAAPQGVAALPAVFVLPTDPGALAGANAALARLGVPWRFGAPQGGDAALGVRDASFRGDTLVRLARWAPLVAARAGAAGDTLATVGSAPLVVAGEGWVVVGTALDAAATNFPVRAAFVPWLLETVDRAAGGSRAPFTVAAADARESDLARATPATIRTALGDDDRHVVTADARAWRDAVRSGGAGRSIVVPLLLVALACLAAEGWLARRPARARGAPAPSMLPA